MEVLLLNGSNSFHRVASFSYLEEGMRPNGFALAVGHTIGDYTKNHHD